MFASDGHVEDHDVAALFGLAGDLGLDASRERLFERAEIALLIGHVGQLFLGADVVPENVFRRRHARLLGQMINKRRHELRLGRRFLHELRKIRVVLSRGGRRFLCMRDGWDCRA